MKILFIASDLSVVGGIQRYNKIFIHTLRRLGENVKLAEWKNRGYLAKALFAAKIFVHTIVFRPDLVVSSHVNFGSICFWLKKLFGINYIVTLFGIEARAPEMAAKRKIFEEAKKICTVSEYTVEKLLKAMPEVRKKLFFLENPIDGNAFYIGEKPKYLLDRYQVGERRVILTVARFSAMEKYKGYDKVLDALPLLKSRLDNFVYILVGDGDDRARAEELTRRLHLQTRVVFAGLLPESELADHYNLADVFIMPSKREGFGYVFIEALASGVPVVAGNADGSPNAVLGGKLGLLVNPESSEEIADALFKILSGRVPGELLNRRYLRETILAEYGVARFEEKCKKLLYVL